MRPVDRNQLVFIDRFNSWSENWSTRQSVQSGIARADASCARVVNGEMVVSVKSDPENPGKYLTGHIGTQGDAEFTYGYFETKAKFPTLRGAHSAFWLQTTEDYIPGQAEIDAVECFGRATIWHNVYWREPGQGAGEFTSAKLPHDLGKQPAQAEWHVYAVDWRPEGYYFYVDGNLVNTITTGLSDRPKFLVLSILIKDFETEFLDPGRLKDYKARFKYVKVWQ